MLGILGDAILISVGIPLIAALTYPLWYPPLKRAYKDWQSEVDKANRSVEH